MKPTPSQSDVRASLRGRLEDVIEELEAVRDVMRDELHHGLSATVTVGFALDHLELARDRLA